MRQYFHLNYQLFLLIVALVSVFISCEFEPIELQEKKIEKPSEIAPGILINLTPDTDTIKTDENTVIIQYDALADPRKINKIVFIFDGETIQMHEYPRPGPAQITLETWRYTEGLHSLDIIIFTNSNSGSIADKLGAEGYAYTINWPLIIDRTPVKSIYFSYVLPVEQGVSLKWEMFDHPAFRNYTVRKNSYSGDDYVFEISDPHINYFIDTTYLEGERVTYSIGLNSWYSDYEEYIELPEVPVITKSNDFSVKVQWKGTRNPRMLDYYFVYLENDYPVYHPEYKIYHADSTSTIINNIAFGKKYNLVLQYVPKTSGYPNIPYIYKGEKEFLLGDSIQPHSVSRSIPGTNVILLVNNNQVYAYNISTKSVQPILNAEFDIPWSINVCSSGQYFGYFFNGEFFLHNSSTYETEITLPSTLFSSNRKFVYTISDNHRLLVGYQNGTLAVYDLITGDKIAEKPGDGYQFYAKISNDGNFVMTRDYKNPTSQTYYRIADSLFIEYAHLPEPDNAISQSFTFSPDGRLFLFYKNRTEIRDALNFELLYQYDLPVGYVEAWDFDTDRLLIQDYSTEKAYLLDINSGAILRSMFVSGAQFLNIKNDYILSEYGRIMKIPDNTSQKHIGDSKSSKDYKPNFNKTLK